jgi:cellulose biosynthesis protein BcsQ
VKLGLSKPRRKVAVTSQYTVPTAVTKLEELHPSFDTLPRPRVIAFAAGKGGAGKTSCAANVASMLSAANYRILVIDMDVQANQQVLFGVANDAPGLDDGKGLTAAIVTGDASHANPIRDVRPGVDLIPAGHQTRKLSDYLSGVSLKERHATVRSVIEELAEGYDLTVIDSRPSGELLGEIALLASDYVVIPTRTDAMSWDQGLNTIARLYEDAGADARLLGVVLFATQRGAVKIQAETRAQINNKLDAIAPVLSTVIYHSEKAAKDQSEAGLTADEYAAAAVELARPFWEDPSGPRFASNSRGNADDYASLTVEIIEEMLKPAGASLEVGG